MSKEEKYTNKKSHKEIISFIKMFSILCFALLFSKSYFLKAQVVNNSGVTISVPNGAAINTDTIENMAGTFTNYGILDITGNYKNAGTTNGNGTYYIGGNWINTGIFNPDNCTVIFNGTAIQSIASTGGETFFNLSVDNTGSIANNRIVLSNNVTVTGNLTLNRGNIETVISTLFLSNQSPASLNYTSFSGSRIIGEFERGVNTTGNYLFPVGSNSNYNPLNLNINTVPTAGSVLSEFIATDPDDAGLPLTEGSVEVYQTYDDGYWSLTANSFSCTDYNIDLDGSGFLTPLQAAARIIKRLASADWSLDGTHSDAVGTIAYRNNLTGGISVTGNHFAIAHAIFNTAPVFISSTVTDANTQIPYNYTVLTSDAQSDILTIICTTSLPAWLTFTDNGNGTATLSGTPQVPDIGSIPINLNVSDGLLSTDQSFTLIVQQSINNKPVVEDINVETYLEHDIEICLDATDVDNDILSITNIIIPPSYGNSYLRGSDLCLDYSPNRSYFGTDYMQLVVCDDGIPVMCDTASIRITISNEDPILPNEGISPDGDNINDIWIIHGIEDFPENNIKIYTRSGQLIYEAVGYNNTSVIWDGTANRGLHLGNKVPRGTYFFFIEILSENKRFNGFIIVK